MILEYQMWLRVAPRSEDHLEIDRDGEILIKNNEVQMLERGTVLSKILFVGRKRG